MTSNSRNIPYLFKLLHTTSFLTSGTMKTLLFVKLVSPSRKGRDGSVVKRAACLYLVWFPAPHVKWLITFYHSSSRGTNTPLASRAWAHMCTNPHRHKNIYIIKNKVTSKGTNTIIKRCLTHYHVSVCLQETTGVRVARMFSE